MSTNWIKLNVGGQIFHTTLTTLLSCADSLLGKMFDPDSGFEPAYNKDGVYFLDTNPKYFAVILDWLRYRKVMVNSDINVSNVAVVADYFGLEELVKEIREIGAVVITSEEQECSGHFENFGECLGLYLKQVDNTYHQAGGKMFLYQASGGAWYISDTLTRKDGHLRNDTSKESNILPRTDWQYKDEDEWKNADLKITDIKEFTFCNEITLSSTKYSKKEFLGKFRRMSRNWLNGWPVYKNKEGTFLGMRSGFWSTDLDEDNIDINTGAISNNKVISCLAHVKNVKWKYWHVGDIPILGCRWIDDETFKVKCDVHKN